MKNLFTMVCKAAFVAALTLFLCSCGHPEYLSADELRRYILDADNGLVKSESSGPYSMQVTYRPTDLIVLQQLGNTKQPDPTAVEQARAKFGAHYYFLVRLSRSGHDILDPTETGLNGFSDLLQTVSFRMSEHVRLSTPTDTISVADYIYDRTFGMSQGTEMLFVFDKSKAANQEWIDLIVDEFGLGTGKQSVRFSVADLEGAPKIFR